MFWDKKEDKKGLPELPPIRPSFKSFDEDDSDVVEKSALPSFPEDEEERVPELPPKFKAPKLRTVEEIPPRKMSTEMPSTKTEDVYVKIDRFHSARKALNGARDKLKEIEEVMRKIRETRLREEQELASWEKDIDSVKTKVEDVTKNIFEKIE